ncbi:MAG: M15 family metallopeptidase [Clostridiales bacterium]|nr:M15 family metallopeptidase [Clostridiales bacterium]
MDYLILVNKKNPIPKNFCPDLVISDNGKMLEKSTSESFLCMKSAALCNGLKIKLLSGYRSPEYQENLIKNGIIGRISMGMTKEEAEIDTYKNIAPPYCSEHNTGLALDIVTEEDDDVYDEFDKTMEFRWLKENAQRYGFILRYPQNSIEITGYIYEPWHFRYVGKDLARAIEGSDKTLEEYLTYCE